MHTKSLRNQTEIEILKDNNIATYKFNSNLAKIIDVKMITEGSQILSSNSMSQYHLIVIDEAHHSGASSYQPFFRNDIGILGLTATPARSDGVELKFDDDLYYSISFRELVNRGVLIEPKIISIKTNVTINIQDLDHKYKKNQLEAFNTKERNFKICSELFKKIDKYKLKKIIVFVGTNIHVK